MDYLIFESREEDLPALMLLVISLERCAPQSRVHLPAREMSTDAVNWFLRQPNVVVHRDLWAEDSFWNVKPYLLERMLEKGLERITWLDSDIIVNSDPAGIFRVSPETMIVAQEGFRSRDSGTSRRTLAIGRDVGRELGYTVNSCIVSVTAHHSDLLASWKALLRSDIYHAKSRSALLVGDQDILGGLLGSVEFANVPIAPVQAGVLIAHDMLPGDYGILQRLATLWRGEPPFVHSQGRKTWRIPTGSGPSRFWLNQLAMHRQCAKDFADGIPMEMTHWISEDTALSRLMAWMFPSRPSLRGIPIGIYGSALNCAYRLRNRLRRKPLY
ncbi:hypothetical protein [Pseudomonas putida]